MESALHNVVRIILIASLATALFHGGTMAVEPVRGDGPRSPAVFRPFVLVRVPMPEGFTHGAVTAVSDEREAFGWMDGPDGRRWFVYRRLELTWIDESEVPPGRTADNHGEMIASRQASATARAMNNEGEILVVRDDGQSGVALVTRVGQTDYAHELDSALVLTRDPDDVFHDARAINDRLWIGGSYKATSQSPEVPMLIIPFDVDNNGVPDFPQ